MYQHKRNLLSPQTLEMNRQRIEMLHKQDEIAFMQQQKKSLVIINV
jgi:hypothetical protein